MGATFSSNYNINDLDKSKESDNNNLITTPKNIVLKKSKSLSSLDLLNKPSRKEFHKLCLDYSNNIKLVENIKTLRFENFRLKENLQEFKMNHEILKLKYRNLVKS